jgi:hypothetical protein
MLERKAAPVATVEIIATAPRENPVASMMAGRNTAKVWRPPWTKNMTIKQLIRIVQPENFV